MIINCCPLAEVCPNKVLPVIIRSGRELANALSIKKYSCSQPRVAVTFFTFYQNIYTLQQHPLPVTLSIKVFCNLKLLRVRNKTVGIHKVVPRINAETLIPCSVTSCFKCISDSSIWN
jgi:hypothetical protein